MSKRQPCLIKSTDYFHTNEQKTLSIGSHRNGIKRASYSKISQNFLQYPSLIQRNSERLAQPKINLIYKLFTRFSLLYLPFCKAIEQTKLRSPSLNSHENGVLAGCFFKNSKYIYKYPSQLIALGAIKT